MFFSSSVISLSAALETIESILLKRIERIENSLKFSSGDNSLKNRCIYKLHRESGSLVVVLETENVSIVVHVTTGY